jgi:hypothetical protein
LIAGIGAVGAGCLSRPVTKQEPTTKTNFTSVVRSKAVDKIDLLFAIDNSASMGDKQEILREAVPDLVNRLVTPNCVADNNPNQVVGVVDAQGRCATGKPEFAPITDIHIGIVSSSLGGRGSNTCPADARNPANGSLSANNDDKGHLLNRSTNNEVPSPSTGSSNFLAWFPDSDSNVGKPAPENPIKDAQALIKSFQDLVDGVNEYGCGFEAQLESVYRFLIQPDPHENIVVEGRPARARLEGVDNTILKQRKDFLRPDSLVAVIMVTDETDSTVDPLAVSGQGWAYLNDGFPGGPGTAARGTSVCESNPLDPGCDSCGFKRTKPELANDPNCQDNDGYYRQEEDQLNIRPIRMKQRFGVDPQYPIQRYVKGFLEDKVPNRDGEHPVNPETQLRSSAYVGTANCRNPLYAANLPESGDEGEINGALCNLSRGPRQSDLVFFGLIGGVPHQLLHYDPNDVEKSKLTDADWVKILGRDPFKYDFEGIDPHMIESVTPRDGLEPSGPGLGSDPIHGREWNTAGGDIQFACTFELPEAKDCTRPEFKEACDCVAGSQKNPPLCDPARPTIQVRGKAYPTVRQLMVVRQLGDQGIVSSLCPINPKKPADDATNPDPLYGYRPAVKAIVDRLRNALTTQCLPQQLNSDPATGKVPCLILETAPVPSTSACDASKGRKEPDPQILQKFLDGLEAEAKRGGDRFDRTAVKVCEIEQLTTAQLQNGSCAEVEASGWCYVRGGANSNCAQSIEFSKTGSPAQGAFASLQCIKSNESADGGVVAE